ncbi:MFS transporter permease [Geodermatophilus sp. DSM 44513]|uniref:MFS transporter permease n=1 Tax=Geodermatophilus sp. DSM 44513 TaxID=1528104 RepID=UPI00127ACF5D|nr:MFS transporter permease [Geodermatophilus sp. DSM 44513]WNV74728.1 MFS transporter permease [Geodermatophilus sp. DSM 44513]
MSATTSADTGPTADTPPSPRRRGLSGWWFRPVPLARVAVVRTLAYLFVPVDVFLTTAWIRAHADVPPEWYAPLTIGRLLPLPTPTTAVVTAVQWALVAAALVAATGRSPRLLGSAVFLLYLQWMVIGMSYGKVDHDRIGYLVLLAVLPTVGRVRWRDRRSSEAAGWAMAAVFVTVVLTYFLAAWAKVRFGGWDWATGSTLARAIVRRGTVFSEWTLEVPGLLVGAQWAMLALEFATPLVLLVWSNRARVALVVVLLGFHLAVYASVTIIFLPHCVAVLSILPWERVPEAARRLRTRGRAGHPAGAAPAGAAPPG